MGRRESTWEDEGGYFVDKCKEKKPRSVTAESTTADGRFTSGWC